MQQEEEDTHRWCDGGARGERDLFIFLSVSSAIALVPEFKLHLHQHLVLRKVPSMGSGTWGKEDVQ